MLLLIGAFLLLMIIGTPIAVSMAVASLLYLVFYNVAPDIIAAQRMIAGVESFPLLAVPFFILVGNLMNIAGVTGRIYHFALSLVGWMKVQVRPIINRFEDGRRPSLAQKDVVARPLVVCFSALAAGRSRLERRHEVPPPVFALLGPTVAL